MAATGDSSAGPSAGKIGAPRPGVFVRNATGLVREAGAWDVFIFNSNNQNLGIGALFILLFLGFYNGGNLELATILTMLCTIPMAVVYALFAAAMPRSGGDYVYNSRTLGPIWGFVSSFNWLFWMLVYVGVPAAFVSSFGIAPWFRMMGAMSGNTTLVAWGNGISGLWGTIIAGTLLLLLFAAIFVKGVHLYFRIQNWGFMIAMVGLAAGLGPTA